MTVCPDGQRKFDIELITRIPCEQDGKEYADYPARVVITSSEPDQIFESYARKALRTVLKSASPEQRDDYDWLTECINRKVGHKFDRVGYLLLDVNLGEDPLTPVAVLAKYFPSRWNELHPESTSNAPETGNVTALPVSTALTVAEVDLGIDQAETS